MVRLENEWLRIEVNSFGGELRSIFDKTIEKEIMWNGSKEWWNRVSPVLFPIVGSLRNKEFRHEGKTYTMPNHGFLRDNEMILDAQSDSEVWYRFESNEDTRVIYPFDFVVKIGYRLKGRTVEVLWHVENTGDDAMYYSIGAHPAFLAKEGDYFLVEGNGFMNRYPITAEGIMDPYPENVDKIVIKPEIFVDDALVYDNTTAVTLVTRDAKIRVSYEDFLYMGLWSSMKEGSMAPFVCIEPWVGIADFSDFSGELRNKEGMIKLGPDNENAYIYTIEVDSI